MRDIIGWDDAGKVSDAPASWRPHPLSHVQWPPDYDAVYRWRIDTLRKLQDDPELLASARTYYRTHKKEFIMDWMDTYDPRKASEHEDPLLRGDKWMPFVFFDRQAEFIDWLQMLDNAQENGLTEKSRDMGATWAACGYSLACWLFEDDDATGWGSRKQDLVDKIGDPDSIFEKMRLLLKRLPAVWHPRGFNWARHATFMKLVNPENGSIISGEAGDNIGRGGRKTRYFKDESSHYERPEKIESAVGDNTNVQIDISSVNGLGNVFHRRRENGVDYVPGDKLRKGYVSVFVMDWKHHPAKTQDWYNTRKAKYEREGLGHIFAQEVDRNYSAAVSNVVIPYEHILAAVDAHKHIYYFAKAAADPSNQNWWVAGLDVADEGGDRNALSMREWVIWRKCEEWGYTRDVGASARMAISACRDHAGRITCMYDSIGLGAGVKAEYNRLVLDEELISAREVPFIPWNAGAAVKDPYERIIPDDEKSLLNKDYYENLKAQGWIDLARRFYKTWNARTNGVVYDPNELISLDSTMPLLSQLMKELAQPTRGPSARLKTMIEKKPDGTKSPNLADSGMQMYFPVEADGTEAVTGNYGY